MVSSSAKATAVVRWVAAGAGALTVVYLLRNVLPPFLLALGLAYLLASPVDRLVARGVPRALAVLGVEALALVAAAGLVLLVIPVLLHEIPLLREQVPRLAGRFNDTVAPWLGRQGIAFTLDVAAVKNLMVQILGGSRDEWMAAGLNSLRIGGSVALAVVGYVVLVPVALYYLLMDAPRMGTTLVSWIPPRWRAPVLGFLRESDAVLGRYLRGQFLVMGALAVYYTLLLALLGFDLAIPVGVFSGLAVVVPYVGFGIGVVLALLTGILQFGVVTGALMVLGVYGLGQFLESFVLTPRWVGESIGLTPLAVIFALLAFGELFGFVGVLLALPASAVLLVFLRRAGVWLRSTPLYRD